jgi:hypothetical protein
MTLLREGVRSKVGEYKGGADDVDVELLNGLVSTYILEVRVRTYLVLNEYLLHLLPLTFVSRIYATISIATIVLVISR